MRRLDGKVLLVTGGARGLGELVARLGAAQGAKVLIVDILDELGASVAASIGDEAAYLHVDVRQEADWTTAVALAESRFGHLDVLINNAAILRVGPLETFSIEDFRDVIEVNQIGPFLGMRAVIPAMRAAGRGSIINVSSTDGLFGRAGVIAYGGSKWALRGMTKIAAQELGPLNIRVNSVHPGGIQTEMSRNLSGPGVEITRDQVKMRWALNRFPELEEVVNVILFLASEEATYTTGAEISCDGGATIGPRYV